MAIHVTSAEQYNDYINGDKLVIVDYWAPWCGPCRMIAPALEALAEEHTEAIVLKVNVDELSEISQNEGVSGIPTFKAFKNGEELYKFSGANKTSLKKMFELA